MRHRFRPAAVAALAVMGVVVALVPASPAFAETPGASRTTTISGVRVQISLASQWLYTGGSWDFGNAHLVMQSDGNLVLYKKGTNQAKWASNTRGSGANQMRFQKDGNLVIYAPGNRAVWSSRTNDKCFNAVVVSKQPVLALQNDSNFVVYCEWTFATGGIQEFVPMWATNTNGI